MVDATPPAHAFNALGNLLGVRWSSQMQTPDMDLAADADVDLTIPPNMPTIGSALEQLEMGFLPVPALLLSQRDLVLINVPDPARFAWHKLLVSEERPLAMAAKRAKDRLQAAQLLAVLQEEAPTQLATARTQFKARGRGWSQRPERALAQCEACAAALAGDHPHP